MTDDGTLLFAFGFSPSHPPYMVLLGQWASGAFTGWMGQLCIGWNKFTLVVSSTTPWSSSPFIDTWLDANLGLSEWTVMDSKVLDSIVTYWCGRFDGVYLIQYIRLCRCFFGVRNQLIQKHATNYQMPMTSITVLPDHCTSVLCEDGSGPPSAGLYSMHRRVYSPFGISRAYYVASFGLI